MNVLLTGATGFIGSYFQKQYAQQYTIQTFSFMNDNFESLHVKGIDVVVHLSALVHQMGGASVEEYERVNVMQTLALAKKAKESGVGQFIFMSTVKVYGEETNVPYAENSLCKPEDEYGKSKLKAERALQELEDETFKISIVRTPIVYGYGVKANIKSLIKLIDTIPILPFGSIDNKRSFVYVGNLYSMIERIIETQKSGVFLASDDKPLSTTRLIELIANAKHKKMYLLHVKIFELLLKWLKPSFYKRLFESLEMDNTQSKKVLDFKNPYTTVEGINYIIHGED